jgi:hypothetical protein
MTNFKNDLNSLSWNDVTSVNDVDECFDVFWDSFSTLYDLHFPLVKFKFNKNKHSKNDFMTPGLLISRLHKIELHKKSIVDPTSYLERYRQYRNVFNSVVRASKKIYYDAKFLLHAKNPKKIWSLLNEITSNKTNKNNVSIPYIEVEGSTIDSPPDIANEFNAFFVKAGQNISDRVPHTNRTPESFIPHPINPPPDLDFGNINALHVSDIIKSFPNKQSLDINGISLKLLKFFNTAITFSILVLLMESSQVN